MDRKWVELFTPTTNYIETKCQLNCVAIFVWLNQYINTKCWLTCRWPGDLVCTVRLWLIPHPPVVSVYSLWIGKYKVRRAHSEPPAVPVRGPVHFDLPPEKTPQIPAVRPIALWLLAKRPGFPVHVLRHPQLDGGRGRQRCLQGRGLLRLHGTKGLRERGATRPQLPVLGVVPLRRGLLLLPRREEGGAAGGEDAQEDRFTAGLAQPDAALLRSGLQRRAPLRHTTLQRPPAACVRRHRPQHHRLKLTDCATKYWNDSKHVKK